MRMRRRRRRRSTPEVTCPPRPPARAHVVITVAWGVDPSERRERGREEECFILPREREREEKRGDYIDRSLCQKTLLASCVRSFLRSLARLPVCLSVTLLSPFEGLRFASAVENRSEELRGKEGRKERCPIHKTTRD